VSIEECSLFKRIGQEREYIRIVRIIIRKGFVNMINIIVSIV